MPGRYDLLSNPQEISAAFDIWRTALMRNAVWRDDRWRLAEKRLVFGNRNDRAVRQLGDFVEFGTDPTGASVTVQLNEPQQYGNENPLSGVARDGEGRLHLVRQGILHQNAQSERVDGDLFAERTGLEAIDLRVARKRAKRPWFVVTALDIPDTQISENIADFVDYCSWARGVNAATVFKEDEGRLENLFGKPEKGGASSGTPTVHPNRRRHVQGEVWLALQALLTADGRELRKPRHARGYEVDGEIDLKEGRLLLEIKTGVSAAEVYGGVGQLTLYPRLLPRLTGHDRILLLPGLPRAPLVEALEGCGVELHSYDLRIDGDVVKAVFSKAFLRRCELP